MEEINEYQKSSMKSSDFKEDSLNLDDYATQSNTYYTIPNKTDNK